MKNTISAVLKISVALTLVAACSLSALSGNAPRITKEELKSMLGDPNLVIVDLRRDIDWNSSEYKIKGAVRGNPDPSKVEAWASSYGRDNTFVVY
jgi:Rhodanese-like domain